MAVQIHVDVDFQPCSACPILSITDSDFAAASFFAMLSEGQMYIMNSGDNLNLFCEFHTAYFNLFDNPVIWIKEQFQERSDVNIMGNIKTPFKETERFGVTFTPLPPRYMLELSIHSKWSR